MLQCPGNGHLLKICAHPPAAICRKHRQKSNRSLVVRTCKPNQAVFLIRAKHCPARNSPAQISSCFRTVLHRRTGQSIMPRHQFRILQPHHANFHIVFRQHNGLPCIPCIVIGFDTARLKTFRNRFYLRGFLQLQHGSLRRYHFIKAQCRFRILRCDLPDFSCRAKQASACFYCNYFCQSRVQRRQQIDILIGFAAQIRQRHLLCRLHRPPLFSVFQHTK